MDREFDVAIIGGGLAGSCLALQLKLDRPSTKILLIEKKKFPIPQGEGTVGESTVEIASHYFGQVLGLKDHLEFDQLPKLGLRYFLETEDPSKIENRLEVGGNRYAPTPTYQLDRASLENCIWERLQKHGVSLLSNCTVKSVDLESELKTLTFFSNQDKEFREISAKWIVDASGRTSLFKKKLNLRKKVDHNCNAAWWRLKGEHKIDHWCKDKNWGSRNFGENERWFSTNHLMGEGYWVWIIPLACGVTSFGVVADGELHPFSKIGTYSKVLSWLNEHEPQLAALCEKNQENFQDFGTLKNYSYSAETVYSADAWALTGEAGAFVDPLYSPGSDFIAISNGYITDLISRSLSGENIRLRASIYNGLYLRFIDSTFNTFRGQYKILGNPEVLPIKIFWDWCFYWNFLSRLFFENKLLDLSFMQSNKGTFERLEKLGIEMQNIFSIWNDYSRPKSRAGFLDLARHPYLFDLNRSLLEYPEAETFEERFQRGIMDLENISREIKRIVISRGIDIDSRDTNDDILFPIVTPFYKDLSEFLVA